MCSGCFFLNCALIVYLHHDLHPQGGEKTKRKEVGGKGEETRQDCPGEDRVRIVRFSRVKVKKRAKDRRVGRRRRRWRMTWGACCSRNHQEEWWMQAGRGEVRWKRDNNEWDWERNGRETNNPVPPPLCGVQESSGQMDERRDGWVGGRKGGGGGKVWKREKKVRRDSALTRFKKIWSDIKHQIWQRPSLIFHFLISL